MAAGAPLINYTRVTEIAFQLKGSSSSFDPSEFNIDAIQCIRHCSVGGCRMAHACCELRDASEAYSKERVIEDSSLGQFFDKGFDRVRREYLVLRENLNQILQR
ncbi:hypothetical protein Prudu_011905 [Prunus dulcis]|uniref:Uncharacterized protein n=1 Tax=Prunus dulcis TaxID=3755 RepID=A0A4Y1RBL1_PRUDU|nr:hypothetical protein Prudu_011905 [Prunus dulcis]